MNGHSTRTFQSGNSEAVRLPKGMGFGVGTHVRIVRDGDRLVITPVEDPEAARAINRKLIEDLDRIRGGVPLPREEREPFEFPDRGR